MFNKISNLYFFMFLMLGTILTLSSNSWFGMWMGLEINMMSLIPLMTSKNNLNYSEAALNYFLIQALTSSIMLFSANLNLLMKSYMLLFMSNLTSNLIFLSMMMKMGAGPLHFWLPNIVENNSWIISLILLTWQKIAPMIIISYLMYTNNVNSQLMLIFILLTAFIGSIGGLNQTSIRKLLTFSSISNISWMILALMINENLWMNYFLIYSINMLLMMKLLHEYKIFYMNQMHLMLNLKMIKFFFMFLMLSLGGLPPFMGFLPKWLVIQFMIFQKMNFLILFVILMSLINLYFYLKMTLNIFLLNYTEINWNYINMNIETKSIYMMSKLNFMFMIMLPIMMNWLLIVN